MKYSELTDDQKKSIERVQRLLDEAFVHDKPIKIALILKALKKYEDDK